LKGSSRGSLTEGSTASNHSRGEMRKEFEKVLPRKGEWIGNISRIKSKSESGLFGQPENSSPSGEKRTYPSEISKRLSAVEKKT